jgi:hypothetical protein
MVALSLAIDSGILNGDEGFELRMYSFAIASVTLPPMPKEHYLFRTTALRAR